MAAFYSLLCKAIKKQPAGRSGRLFWRSGRDSNPRAIARKLISSFVKCVTGTAHLVSVSDSFVPAAKPHKCWAFHIESPRKPAVSG